MVSSQVQGVAGIMQAYSNAVRKVALSGPTYFSEIIESASVIAATPYTANTQVPSYS